MAELICERCKQPFEGRPNRKCCSVKCRRILENKRRFWDTRFRRVRYCEIHGDWDFLTVAQRAYWYLEADRLREMLLKQYGPRP